jgi:hypothetical protein
LALEERVGDGEHLGHGFAFAAGGGDLFEELGEGGVVHEVSL